MNTANPLTGVTAGIEGFPVEAETFFSSGRSGLHLVGLQGRETETRDRVRAAIINNQLDWPERHITVTLYPASMPKPGSGLDLAIAMSVLTATGTVPSDGVATSMFVAELGLDGSLRAVPGVLPLALAAAERGVTTLVVAPGNAAEAAAVPGLRVLTPQTLGELVERQRASHWLQSPDGLPDTAIYIGEQRVRPDPRTRAFASPVELAHSPIPTNVRRAVEVAAAGGHHMLIAGTRGAPGRAPLVADTLIAILPDLDEAEALEVAKTRSVADLLETADLLDRTPPFQDVHHSAATSANLVGRSTRSGLRPGPMPLAHNGVLFVDDAPELPRGAVDAIHRALQDGEVRLTRQAGFITLPARFQLLLGTGLCGCETTAKPQECLCSSHVRRRYPRGYLGRLTDHIAVRTVMPSLPTPGRTSGTESTSVVAERVAAARTRARARLAGTPWNTNAQVPLPVLWQRFLPDEPTMRILERPTEHLSFHDRGQVIRLSWTLADLSGLSSPGSPQVKEALELFRMPTELTRHDAT